MKGHEFSLSDGSFHYHAEREWERVGVRVVSVYGIFGGIILDQVLELFSGEEKWEEGWLKLKKREDKTSLKKIMNLGDIIYHLLVILWGVTTSNDNNYKGSQTSFSLLSPFQHELRRKGGNPGNFWNDSARRWLLFVRRWQPGRKSVNGRSSNSARSEECPVLHG